MRLILIPLLAIVPALAGCASTPASRAAAAQQATDDQVGLRKELAGLVPAERGESCLNSIDLRNAQAIRNYGPTIVYSLSRSVKYVTTTSGGCDNLDRDILVTVSNSGQLCRGDIARTVDRVARFQTGSCSFGDFVRYRRPS